MPTFTAVPHSYKLIAVTQRAPTVGTHILFDVGHARPLVSPLDQFIANTASINVIFIPYTQQGRTLPRTLGFLITLGYMSAVESYFRTIIRGLINIDEHVRKLAEPRSLSFGAAIYHDVEMLPEALLEDISFASVERLKEAFRDFLGVKGNFPPDYLIQLNEFKKLCELRHCCVHRFGQLGTKNAISSGLASHKSLLEKPFAPTVNDIQNISDMLRTFVMSSNNFLFKYILERTARNKDDKGEKFYATDWAWNYYTDLDRFRKYYDLFATKNSAQPSARIKDIYKDFRVQNKK